MVIPPFQEKRLIEGKRNPVYKLIKKLGCRISILFRKNEVETEFSFETRVGFIPKEYPKNDNVED